MIAPTLAEACAAVGTRSVKQWNILFELVFAGRLDEGRLRHALLIAAQVNPFSRARREVRPDGSWCWRLTPDLANDVLRALNTATAGSDAILRELQSERLAADTAPAFRCVLVRSPVSDRLIFNFCHERTDGIGAMAFLVSLQRAYVGQADSMRGDEWIAYRYSDRLDGQQNLTLPGMSQPEPIEHLVPEAGQARTHDTHIVRLALTPAELIKLRQSTAQGATITHRIVAAASIAADIWNGERGKASDRICVAVPVNARPKEWLKEGFFNRYGTMFINSSAGERACVDAAVRSVASQARLMIPMAKDLADGFARPAPAAVIPNYPPAPIPDMIVPTVAVSNLGAWELAPFGDAGPVLSVWATPPAQAPLGVALGVLGLSGQLLISFRFAEAMIGKDGAHRFVQLVRAQCL